MGKNVVLFFDGTWNAEPHPQSKLGPTNVYKLFKMASKNGDKQVTEYFPGVGTTVSQQVRGGTLGYGMSSRIIAGYKFIIENYEEGDRLFLFGFSRGAASARILASWLNWPGLLPREVATRHAVDEAYAAYQRWCSSRTEKTRRSIRSAIIERLQPRCCPVHMLGMWDCVAALGVPVRFFYKREAGPIRSAVIGLFAIGLTLFRGLGERPKFHDFNLAPNVTHALHALAIDEERRAFEPSLCDPREDPKTTLRQVWFSGVHADVGGGYKEHGLSDIPLVWMAQMAKKHGLLIDPHHGVRISEYARSSMHDSRDTWISKLIYRRQPRQVSCTALADTRPVVHESALHRADYPWILHDYTFNSMDVEPWIRYQEMDWSN